MLMHRELTVQKEPIESPSTLLLAKKSRFGTPTTQKGRSSEFAIVLHIGVDELMMMLRKCKLKLGSVG
jgi:hypothetical protein